jgi:hypothetical protein
MKKQISTEQTDANVKEILRLLAETPVQLEKLSKGVSDKQLREPLGKGERSFVQALAHILNCEARTTEAIQLALLANEPAFTPIHAERDLGKLLQYETFPFDELLAYFKFRRKVLLRALESLTEKKWSRVVREEGKQRKESVYWQARGQALHELEHVQDLERKLNRKS